MSYGGSVALVEKSGGELNTAMSMCDVHYTAMSMCDVHYTIRLNANEKRPTIIYEVEFLHYAFSFSALKKNHWFP